MGNKKAIQIIIDWVKSEKKASGQYRKDLLADIAADIAARSALEQKEFIDLYGIFFQGIEGYENFGLYELAEVYIYHYPHETKKELKESLNTLLEFEE